MKTEELKTGMKVWSMIANNPEEFEVHRIMNLYAPNLRTFPSVSLIRENHKSIHRRYPEQLCKTKEELRIKIFGK